MGAVVDTRSTDVATSTNHSWMKTLQVLAYEHVKTSRRGSGAAKGEKRLAWNLTKLNESIWQPGAIVVATILISIRRLQMENGETPIIQLHVGGRSEGTGWQSAR